MYPPPSHTISLTEKLNRYNRRSSAFILINHNDNSINNVSKRPQRIYILKCDAMLLNTTFARSDESDQTLFMYIDPALCQNINKNKILYPEEYKVIILWFIRSYWNTILGHSS